MELELEQLVVDSLEYNQSAQFSSSLLQSGRYVEAKPRRLLAEEAIGHDQIILANTFPKSVVCIT